MRFAPFGSAWLTAGLLVASSPLAHAQGDDADGGARDEAAPSSEEEHAMELFQASAGLYRDGRFKEAAAALREAYALSPTPVILFNLAKSLEGAGDLVGAIDAYTAYLRDEPDAPDRKGIETRIASLTEQKRKLDAKPKTKPVEIPVAPIVVMGVGAAAAGTGIVFAVMSQGKHDDATRDEASQVEVRELNDEANTFGTVATVGIIAGSAVLAAGAAWLFLDLAAQADEEPAPPRVGVHASVDETGALLGVEGRF